jgi:hypothetical protein
LNGIPAGGVGPSGFCAVALGGLGVVGAAQMLVVTAVLVLAVGELVVECPQPRTAKINPTTATKTMTTLAPWGRSSHMRSVCFI